MGRKKGPGHRAYSAYNKVSYSNSRLSTSSGGGAFFDTQSPNLKIETRHFKNQKGRVWLNMFEQISSNICLEDKKCKSVKAPRIHRRQISENRKQLKKQKIKNQTILLKDGDLSAIDDESIQMERSTREPLHHPHKSSEGRHGLKRSNSQTF